MRKKASSPRLFKCLNRFQYPDAHTYEQVIEVNRTQGNCGQDQPRTGKGGREKGSGCLLIELPEVVGVHIDRLQLKDAL